MQSADQPEKTETHQDDLKLWLEPKLKVTPIAEIVKQNIDGMVESMTITDAS
jgi:hypothetical protein